MTSTQHPQLRVHLGRGRVRGHHRPDPRKAEGGRPRGGPGHRRAHRRLRHRSTWDALADALADKYAGIATRIALYNFADDHERFERYGEVARRLQG